MDTIQSQVGLFVSALVGRRERTLQAYAQDVRGLAAWWEQEMGAGFDGGSLTSLDMHEYRKWSLDVERVRPATWNRRLASLRVFCGWLRDERVLRVDVLEGVSPADEVELPPRWLDKVETNRFERQVERCVNGAATAAARRRAVMDRGMVGLMLYAGLREGEVCGLEVGDVELGERSGRVVIRDGKGGKRRVVPLSRKARSGLADWLVERGAGAGSLFSGVSERTVQRHVAEVGRLVGLSVTPHDLRHTFAKRMVDEGVTLTVVSKLLGHSRLETTTRYVQPGWEDFEKAVEEV